MSKLPKAPLLEVLFELRWKIINDQDLKKIIYLYGDLFSELKDSYPNRESLVPPDFPLGALINHPVHRYKAEPNGYPLVQVGPGILTLNVTDEKYFWPTFSGWVDELVGKFLTIFPFTEGELISPSLIYLDFFPFDFKKDDVDKFINENFHITYNQSFFKNKKISTNINLGFYYEIDEGNLSVTFQNGASKLTDKETRRGVILQTRLDGKQIIPKKKEIISWLNNSHEICSTLFKELTKGKLYESFK